MKKFRQKTLALILALVMIVGMLPVTASAEAGTEGHFLTAADLNLQSDVYPHPFSTDGLTMPRADEVIKSYWQSEKGGKPEKFAAATPCAWEVNSRDISHPNAFVATNSAPCTSSDSSDPNYDWYTYSYSSMSYQFAGPATVEFDWRCSCEDYGGENYNPDDSNTHLWDSYVLVVDGTVVMQMGGETGWQHASYDVTGDELHTIAWMYTKDAGYGQYEDTAFIDNITSTASDSYTLDMEQPALTYIQNGENKSVSDSGQNIAFPYGDVTSCTFSYTPVEGTGYTLTVNGEEINEASVTLNPDVPNRIALVAIGAGGGVASWNAFTSVDTSGCTVNDAVSCSIADANWSFTNDTTHPWSFGVMEDGSPYLINGNSGVDSSESTITLNVNVPDGNTYYLTYEYSYSSESNWDKFYLPNNTELSGNDAVTSVAAAAFTITRIQLEAGAHAISWKYTKDSSRAKGFDGAVLRNLVLSAENNAKADTVTVHYDSGVTGMTYSINGGAPAALASGSSFTAYDLDSVTLEAAVSSGCVFKGFFDSASYARISNSGTYTFALGKEDVSLTAISAANNEFSAIDGFAAPEHLTVTSRASMGWALSNDGGLASGNQGQGGTVSALAVKTDADGVLYYSYRVSSETNYDCLYYSVGTEITDANYEAAAQNYGIRSEFSGTSEVWCEATLPLKAGQTVFFGFRKDGSGDSGRDTAWIKDLRMETNIAKTSLTMTYDTADVVVNCSVNNAAAIPLASGQPIEVSDKDVVVLTAAPASSKVFKGFFDAASGRRVSSLPTCRLTVGTEPISLTASVAPNNNFAPIDGYTAADGLTVMSRPSLGWAMDADGNLVSGNQGQGNTVSILSVKSDIKGILYFDYLTSSESGCDGIYYMGSEVTKDNIDSAENYAEVHDKKGFSGEAANWKTEAVSIDAGQTLYIGYRKDGSGDKGSDTAWLKNICVSTDVSYRNIVVSIDNPDFAVVTDNYDAVDNNATLSYPSGTKCTLTIAPQSRAIFNGWFDANTGKRLSEDLSYRFTVKENVSIAAKVDPNLFTDIAGVTLNDGIESVKSRVNYPWTIDADGNLVSTNTTAGGKDGTVYNVAVKVNKSGLLFFDYKTSSEKNYDCLLYRNGAELTEGNYGQAPNYAARENFSGERDWTTVQMVVSAGDTIYFAYRKDGSGAGNTQDKVWLRNLVVSSGNVTVSAAANNSAYGSVSGNTGSVSVGSKLTLSATPAQGYDFYGWILNGNTVSLDANYSFTASMDAAYEARFAPAGSLEARIGLTFYDTIEHAFAAGDAAILAVNLTLDRDVTIPAGKTLILPYSSSDTTGYLQNSAGCARPSIATREAFRTLTISGGSTLTVNGNLIVGGVQHSADQNGQGQTSGAYARIVNNGTITANGSLTNYGLISGGGTMTLTPTATAKTAYVVTDYAGGTNTDDLYGANTFPFGQYATINIQCPFVIQGGASLVGMTSLYFWSSVHQQDIPLVGTSDGLIVLPVGSTLTATYGATKRVNATVGNIFLGDYGKTTLTIEGNASGGKFDLSGYGSTGMYLNIPYTYDLVINSGTFTMGNLYRVMPGATVQVNEGATLNVTGGLQVMDGWSQYDKSGKEYPSADVLKANGFHKYGSLVVDGTLNVSGTFVGIAQTTGETGKIVTADAATLSGNFFGGSVGGYTDNRVDYSLAARANTGTLTALEKGKTYYAAGSDTFTPANFSLQQHRDGSTKTVNLADQIMHGAWAGAANSVTFNANGGEGTMVSQSFTHGVAQAISANSFSKTGYSFAGWATSADGEVVYLDAASVVINKPITLYAKWTPAEDTAYKVEHYQQNIANDGYTLFETDNLIGTTASSVTPAVKTYEGFTAPTAQSVTIAADGNTVVTYQYTRNSYTLTWDLAGGETTSTAYTVGSVKYGATITEPVDPTKTGYTFNAWNPIVPDTMPAADTTITAQWNINHYTVTFDSQGGSDVAAATVDYNTTVTKPADPTKTGYDFGDWYTDVFCTTAYDFTAVVTENKTLYAKWTAKTFTVSFDSDGGTACQSITVAYGQQYGTLPTPTKTGYKFGGWYDGETRVFDTTAYQKETAVTLKAKWDVDSYTINYFVNNVILEDTNDSRSFGASLANLYQYTKTGYTVSAWKQNDGSDVPETMPAKTLNLYATTSINSYTVTYKVDGKQVNQATLTYNEDIPAYTYTKTGYDVSAWTLNGSTTLPAEMPANNLIFTATSTVHTHKLTYTVDGEEYEGSNSAVAYGTQITLPTTPTKTGYTFSGWKTGDAAATDFTMPDNDVTISGTFAPNTYTVKFDANGGNGTMADQSFTYDVAQNLTANAFTKTGYSFSGWKNGEETYADKASVKNLTAAVNGEVTLTAQWEINQYTITFNTDGGSTVNAITQNYGTAVTAPNAPTKDGFRFDGWDKEIPSTMPAESMTTKAKWTSYQSLLEAMENFDGDDLALARAYYGRLNAEQKNSYNHDVLFSAIQAASKAELTAHINDSTVIANANAELLENENQIAQLTVSGQTVSVQMNDTAYTALNLTKKKFVSILFGGTDVATATVLAANGSELHTCDINSQFEIMQYVAFATIAKENETFDAFRTRVLTDGADTYTIGLLDGKSVSVRLNAETEEGVTYAETYTLEFFNRDHTVTWDADNGTDAATETKGYGDTITAPTEPKKTGYTFNAWEGYTSGMVMGKTDLSFTAQWTAKQYNVTFDNGYSGAPAITAQTVTYDAAFGTLPNPTREGYTFGGWFIGETQILPDTVWTTDDNAELTAHWSVGQGYTISYVGTEAGSNPTQYNVETESFTLVNPTRTGYTFTGWSGTGLTGEENMTVTVAKGSTGNREYTANWTVNRYTITFNTDGGSTAAPITQDYGTTVTAPADPTKTGYTFNGWSEAVPATMPAENKTLTAQWKINRYTISFDSNGGGAVDSITQEFNSAITAPANPTKTGYTFAGWDKEIPARMPAFDVTLTAEWTINQYTITFDTDGGNKIAPITQDYNSNVTAPASPTKTGYTFTGWSPAIPTTMPLNGLTVTAQWTANTYTVTMDANGGSVNPTSITVSYDGTYEALPTPSRDGYNFTGWFDGDKAVNSSDKVSITAAQMLTAHWNAKGDTPYTVEYYQQDVSGDGYTKVDAETADLTAATDSEAQAEIKSYTGFSVNDAMSEKSGIVAADGSLVLKIYYDRNIFTVTWDICGETTNETYRYGAAPIAPDAARADDDNGSYTFTGWDKEIAPVTENVTYTAQYSVSYAASVGGTTYRTLAIALANAKSGDTVRLEQDVSISKDLTVPTGVTLLIPCVDDDPGYVAKDDGNGGTILFNADGASTAGNTGVGPDAKLYRKLTVSEGVTLTVNGTVMVNAVTGRPAAGHYDQDVTGNYAQIDLDGSIVVNGTLENFGYIKGSGTVTANSGATVGDLYIVRNWRGGTQASQIVPYVYPMNEYDLHNIEATLVVDSGATYTAFVKMYANNQYYYTRFPQVDSKNGLIRLADGASLTKTYEAGRETYAISGGASFASSTLKITGLDLSTGMDYFVYPIDGDMSFVLANGAYKFVNDYKFMPGASMLVKSDATLEVGKETILVFYDKFEDMDNTDDTEYPGDRGAAELKLEQNAKLINNGSFAGIVDGRSANVILGDENKPGSTYYYGENGPWSVKTYEANGYNNKCRTLDFEFAFKAHDHVLVKHDAKTATCTEAGNSAYWECEICGEYFADAGATTVMQPDSWVINALGHSFTKYVSDGNASYTQNGTETAKCDRCDVTDTREEEGSKLQPAPSGEGGGSIGGGTSTTNTETLSEGNVSVPATVSGSTATVEEIPASEISKVGNAAVSLDFSSVSGTVNEVKLPAKTVETISESASSGLEVKLSTGTVAFDAVAVEAISEAATGADIALNVETVDKKELSSAQKSTVEGLGNAVIVKATLTSGGKTISDFGGGSATVTVPYEKKTANKAVVVYYLDDAGKLTKMNCTYDVKTKSIIFIAPHFSEYVVTEVDALQFVDVAESEYYADAVRWAATNGITNGTDDVHFSPDMGTTRAQVVTFLWRAAGCPVVNYYMNMSDVKSGEYYTEAVRWALSEGITKGTSATTFDPDAICTRGQIVTFLARFAGVADADTASVFTDVNATDYFAAAVKWAKDNGVTEGTSATTFSPNDDCIRAQVVTFLYRWMVK